MPDSPSPFARVAPGVRTAEPLQAGEFLYVYAGRLESVPGEVQLLVLSPDVSDPAVQSAFERVATDWDRVSDHPGVVTVHARGKTPRPWIAVERVDGYRLSESVQPLAVEDVRSLVSDAAEVLRDAGRVGVHHGALSPDAVWLPTNGGVQVGGWGLERACRIAAGQQPDSPYTPPELAAGDATPDDRTDVYGLGAVAYYALTGQPPDDPAGGAGGTAGIESASGWPPRPSVHNPDVPGQFDAVVRTALARTPRERQDTPYEFKLAVLFGSQGSPERVESANGGATEANSPGTETAKPGEGQEDTRVTAGDRGTPVTDRGDGVGGFPLSRRTALGAIGLGVVGATGWVTRDMLSGDVASGVVPMFQYDAGNTGHARNIRGPRSDPDMAWTVETAGQLIHPIVSEGTVYVGGREGPLAVDAGDGSERWSVDNESVESQLEGFWSPPALADGKVHFVRSEPINNGQVTVRVYAFDAGDGTTLWRSEPINAGNRSFVVPTVADGTVYFSTKDGIHGVDVADGAESWRFEQRLNPGAIQGLDDDRLYFFSEERLHAISRDDRTERWSIDAITGFGLTVTTGSIYYSRVGPEEPAVVALSAASGEQQWTSPINEQSYGPVTVADSTLYTETREGTLYAIDTADGSKRWTKGANQGFGPVATVAGDTVYVSSNDGGIHAFDTADGSERWSRFVEQAPGVPVVVNGTLYVGTGGALYALTES